MSGNKTKADLNLMPSRAKFQAARMRMKLLARKITTIAAIIWLSAAVLALAAWLGSRWWLTMEKAKYQKELNSFLSISDGVVTSQLIKYRAKFLEKVLIDRFEYYEAFSKVGKLFSDKVVIKDFVLKDRAVFMLTLLVNRGELLDEVEKRVEEINSGMEEGVKRAKISGVSYSKSDSGWTVDLEVKL